MPPEEETRMSEEQADNAEKAESTDSTEKANEDDGHNLYVRTIEGDGRPVVLIHGWPLSSDSWSEQIPALQEAGYSVVAYDRRGFGQSDPGDKYDYDSLADDLHNVITDLDLSDVTLVGFSMGGGEVVRYVAKHGTDKLHSVVLAAAVPPYLLKSDDNSDGPLTEDAASEMRKGLEEDRDSFFEQFMTTFFSAGDDLKVSEEQRDEAVALCKKSNQDAALGCMEAFGTTDFRDDVSTLAESDLPVLVIHGDSDGIVPFEGSGKRVHDAIERSDLVVVEGGPHGINVSHADEFNRALLSFLEKHEKQDSSEGQQDSDERAPVTSEGDESTDGS
jgi:pimeloyl-ACP methyl ester carboxylesterase